MEMDKTTLRIILAALGVLLLLGIYLWDRLKKRRRALDETLNTLDAESQEDEIDTISINPIEETAPVDIDVLEAEEANLVKQAQPKISQAVDRGSVRTAPTRAEDTSKQSPQARPAKLPEVIQVSIIAPPEQPFLGDQLLQAFQDLGLEYGEMDIFHAYQGGELQFSVASLVKPGTFPITAMDGFRTRGLTLFLQPSQVLCPAEAFERMIATCHALAKRLGGSELDDRRQPLTAVKISLWRRQLRET